MSNIDKHILGENCFYGAATVGTKGQIVIPAKAREDMGIKPGDSLVVMGVKGHKMIGVCPVSSMEAIITKMSKRLDSIRDMVNESKKAKGDN